MKTQTFELHPGGLLSLRYSSKQRLAKVVVLPLDGAVVRWQGRLMFHLDITARHETDLPLLRCTKFNEATGIYEDTGETSGRAFHGDYEIMGDRGSALITVEFHPSPFPPPAP